MVLRWILRVCGALCLIYYVGCGMSIRFDTAQLWLWLVLGAGCFALDGILGFGRHMGWRLPTGVQAAIWVIFGIGAAAALGMMGLVASHMNDQAPAGADYMLVVGARVNGTDSGNAEASGALLHRCESAAVYAAENPETVFIATGGKGADEPITEAECIKREMVRLGVPEERILLEEQSQSTAENMKYSRAMMEKEDAAVAVVTNNFHVYRAGRLAEAALRGRCTGRARSLPGYCCPTTSCGKRCAPCWTPSTDICACGEVDTGHEEAERGGHMPVRLPVPGGVRAGDGPV